MGFPEGDRRVPRAEQRQAQAAHSAPHPLSTRKVRPLGTNAETPRGPAGALSHRRGPRGRWHTGQTHTRAGDRDGAERRPGQHGTLWKRPAAELSWAQGSGPRRVGPPAGTPARPALSAPTRVTESPVRFLPQRLGRTQDDANVFPTAARPADVVFHVLLGNARRLRKRHRQHGAPGPSRPAAQRGEPPAPAGSRLSCWSAPRPGPCCRAAGCRWPGRWRLYPGLSALAFSAQESNGSEMHLRPREGATVSGEQTAPPGRNGLPLGAGRAGSILEGSVHTLRKRTHTAQDKSPACTARLQACRRGQTPSLGPQKGHRTGPAAGLPSQKPQTHSEAGGREHAHFCSCGTPSP